MIFTISRKYNKEVDDLNSLYTEDDYIEALYAYTYTLENIIVRLLDEIQKNLLDKKSLQNNYFII